MSDNSENIPQKPSEQTDMSKDINNENQATPDAKKARQKNWQNNPLIAVIAAIAIGFAGVSAYKSYKKLTAPVGFAMRGSKMPVFFPRKYGDTFSDLTLKDDNGEWHKLSDFLTKKSNIAYFFTDEPWDKGTLKEEFAQIQKTAKEKDAPLVAVFFTNLSYGRARSQMKSLRESLGIDCPILIDTPAGLFSKQPPKCITCGINPIGSCWYVLNKKAIVQGVSRNGLKGLTDVLMGKKIAEEPSPLSPKSPPAKTSKDNAPKAPAPEK